MLVHQHLRVPFSVGQRSVGSRGSSRTGRPSLLCKGMERRGDARKVWYKPLIILAKAHKSTALAEILRDRPIFDGGDFVGVSADSCLADGIATKRDLFAQHLAFGGLQLQLGLS